MVITGFIAPKIGSYIRVAANRTYFKNNHYTPPWKRVHIPKKITNNDRKRGCKNTAKTAWAKGIEEK